MPTATAKKTSTVANRKGAAPTKTARPRAAKPTVEIALWDDTTDLELAVAQTIRYFDKKARGRTDFAKAAQMAADVLSDDTTDVYWMNAKKAADAGTWFLGYTSGTTTHIIGIDGTMHGAMPYKSATAKFHLYV